MLMVLTMSAVTLKLNRLIMEVCLKTKFFVEIATENKEDINYNNISVRYTYKWPYDILPFDFCLQKRGKRYQRHIRTHKSKIK